MAISALVQWNVRTGGDDTNGAGFKAGASGTDRSLQDAAHATLTVLSLINTDTTKIDVSLTDYTVTSADVGNILQISGGTATAGYYEITAVDTGNNRWTLDRSAGTAAQTVVGKMGGAAASLGQIGSAQYVDENIINIQSGAYSITSSSNNVSGGVFRNNSWRGHIRGYENIPGDITVVGTGTRPVLTVTGAISGFTVIVVAGFGWVENIVIDCASKAAMQGMQYYGAYNCKIINATNIAFRGNAAYGYTIGCESDGCTAGGAFTVQGNVFNCWAHDGTTTGFILGQGSNCYGCISESNSGSVNVHGFNATANGVSFIGCIAYNNAGKGFVTGNSCFWQNCIAEGNAGEGWEFQSSSVTSIVLNCGAYNNSSKYTGNTADTIIINFIDNTTGTFFTNAASGDFSLNAITNQGASAKGTGYPGVFPGGLTTGYVDIGAAQSQGGGASGGDLRIGAGLGFIGGL